MGEKKKEDEKPEATAEALVSAKDEGKTVGGETASTRDNATIGDVTDVVQETIDPPRDVETSSKSPHNRQPSLSLQSKMRSSSFRRTSLSQGPLSPTLNGSKSPHLPALSPDGDAVSDIYRKQAFRLDELEKENKRLVKEVEYAEARWRKTEEELEELREASSQVAELKSRALEADTKSEEVTKLVGHRYNNYILIKADRPTPEIRNCIPPTSDFSPPICNLQAPSFSLFPLPGQHI